MLDPDRYPESMNPKPQHCVSESDPRTDPIFDILLMNLKTQGFGSGSGLDPDSIRSMDPDLNTRIVCVYIMCVAAGDSPADCPH
jgi:hypothetical protein